MPEPQRFFFLHLQKTGGTALFQRLRDAFGASAVYPQPEDHGDPRAVLDVEHLTERYRTQRDELRVITGHFPLCTTEVLGDQLTTFTLLRDPVERTLSLLRRRSVADERFKGMALEAIYADEPLQHIIRNHMAKMLSLRPPELTATPLMAPLDVDATRLDLAKHNLEHQVDAFGFQEQFDEFCDDIATRYHLDLGPPRFANRTEHRPVSDELTERIAEDNQADIELYRFALGLSAARRRGPAVHRG